MATIRRHSALSCAGRMARNAKRRAAMLMHVATCRVFRPGCVFRIAWDVSVLLMSVMFAIADEALAQCKALSSNDQRQTTTAHDSIIPHVSDLRHPSASVHEYRCRNR